MSMNSRLTCGRLWIYSDAMHFKLSKLFCPRAHSLFFLQSQKAISFELTLSLTSFVFHIFRLLRVLDLQQFEIKSEFPGEIELLVQLAFLAIRGKFYHIPSSIAKLFHLETLIVRSHWLSSPDTLWNLRKLKHLYIRSDYWWLGGILPKENLENSPILYELDRLSGVQISHWNCMKRLMRKFPNIRKLKCSVFNEDSDPRKIDTIAIPEFLNQLESLHLLHHIGSNYPKMFKLSLPAFLKKLSLRGFNLSLENISTIGKLSNLEFLKLFKVSFEEDTWEMKEGVL
ncbi:OLC1v1004393C1 [Oldenlandia corymbosa var. corymbosa]|uniref:OLC1v1004393C1 n=1 Tax=Oldenlandia corymbosa var. corymbosa TaxID=529605 RepID=A0AAV1DEM5_OLDCO|nr:OLC1v1004393C1 [Oldenlandia corymbosa var. corymbosa]